MLNLCLCCTVIRQSCNLHTFIRTGQPVLKIGARGIRVFVINLYEIRIKRISPKILKLLCLLLTITGKVVIARAVYLYGKECPFFLDTIFGVTEFVVIQKLFGY